MLYGVAGGAAGRAAASASRVMDANTLLESFNMDMHPEAPVMGSAAAGSSHISTSLVKSGDSGTWGPPGTTMPCHGVGAFTVAVKVPVAADPMYTYPALACEAASVGMVPAGSTGRTLENSRSSGATRNTTLMLAGVMKADEELWSPHVVAAAKYDLSAAYVICGGGGVLYHHALDKLRVLLAEAWVGRMFGNAPTYRLTGGPAGTKAEGFVTVGPTDP